GVGDADRSGYVGPDVVPLDGVARPAVDVGADAEAVAALAGKHVPRAGVRPADRVVGRAVANVDAMVGVPEALLAGRVRADVVAFHDVLGRSGSVELDSVEVGRDDVPGARARAADGVLRRAVLDPHANLGVSERASALAEADEVPLDDVLLRAAPGDEDAGRRVPGDDVPRAGARAADRVATARHADPDSVRLRRESPRGDADEVAPDPVVRACELDA